MSGKPGHPRDLPTAMLEELSRLFTRAAEHVQRADWPACHHSDPTPTMVRKGIFKAAAADLAAYAAEKRTASPASSLAKPTIDR